MGNSVWDDAPRVIQTRGIITKFYSTKAWVEGRAEDQLNQVSNWTGVSKVAAFPDLHPGKYGPVGCAVLADRIYPQLIGNDIGCGMSLFALDLPVRKLKLDKAVKRLRAIGHPSDTDYRSRLIENNLPSDLYPSALGTIGGGNHFCEIQTLVDQSSAELDRNYVYLLVHSGSRGFGNAVLAAMDQGAFDGMNESDPATRRYLENHDKAIRWASLNRQIIAERAAEAVRSDLRLIADAPHNMLSAHHGQWLHRKGAAAAGNGLIPLAGSRATASYLLRACDAVDALQSCAHGAGRRYDRASMHGRVGAKRSDLTKMERNSFGGRIICEDRDLLIEEAPQAYKSSQDVVDDLAIMGVAQPIAKFHPLVTFKKTRKGTAS